MASSVVTGGWRRLLWLSSAFFILCSVDSELPVLILKNPLKVVNVVV